MLTFDDRINRARILLERNGEASGEFLNTDIQESWSRCLEGGLDPRGKPVHKMVNPSALKDLQEENETLIRLAEVEVRNLHSQISGSNFAIVFSNNEGIVLQSIYDDYFDSFANGNCITPGSIWHESAYGTNALGNVAHTHRPSTVHAGEHFYKNFAKLTCVAAPISDPMGKVVGIIDASSDSSARQHHTHVLVKMSCMTIENCLFRNTFQNKLVIEFHHRYEFIGTLQAGLMAFEENGILITSNQQARVMLDGIALRQGIHFEQIFRTQLITRSNSLKGSIQRSLVDKHGSSFAVSVFHPQSSVKPYKAPTKKTVIDRDNSIFIDDDMPRMVCRDPVVKSIVSKVDKAAQICAPLHIRGETGTGKELIARFAHLASRRKGKFVAVNCAALPDNLAESELFGYLSGAFTGASRNGAPGLALQADGGTLFLDEIGDLPYLLQATLLRFLDGWKVRQIGGVNERKVDIQLVTATNRDLEQAVLNKSFRSDLLYRINTVEINLPPLRDRTDLPEIIKSLIFSFKPPVQLEPDAYNAMQEYSWPGNIRELNNILIRMRIEAEDQIITAQHVRNALNFEGNNPTNSCANTTLQDRERRIVMESYRRHNSNVSAVSRELGISRNTVYKKLKAGSSKGKQ